MTTLLWQQGHGFFFFFLPLISQFHLISSVFILFLAHSVISAAATEMQSYTGAWKLHIFLLCVCGRGCGGREGWVSVKGVCVWGAEQPCETKRQQWKLSEKILWINSGRLLADWFDGWIYGPVPARTGNWFALCVPQSLSLWGWVPSQQVVDRTRQQEEVGLLLTQGTLHGCSVPFCQMAPCWDTKVTNFFTLCFYFIYTFI